MSLLASGRLRAATVLACAALAGACSGDAGPAPVARVVVTGIAGPTDSLTVGDRRTLVAAPADRNGGALAGRPVTWTSSDVAVATVDAAGAVSALAPGQATITAESEGVRGQVAVAVRRRPVASLALERLADTLWLGRARTLRALPRAADGSSLADRAVTWSASDTTVVTVATAADGSVVARGVAAGATTLVARSEGATATVPVAVTLVPIARLTLAAPDSLPVGTTATLRATATAPDGTAVSAEELAGRSVVWMSDRAAVIAVSGLADAAGKSPSGFTATARAAAPGNATISAAIDGGLARYTILATRAPVARLMFSVSGPLSLGVGRATTVAAVGLDAFGQVVAGAPLTYSLVSGAGVLRVTQTAAPDGTPTARLDALAPGSATVAVSADGQTTTLDVRVTAGGTALRAFPSSIVAAPGAQGRLTVSLTDAAGTAIDAGTVTYRSTNGGVATVDAGGRVTMVAPGTASVIATTSGGLSATVAVTVAPAPTSTFHIDVRPLGTVPAAVLAAAQQAAARWERVITTALPSERIALAANDCDPGTPAMNEVVDGVVVYLRAEAIDGPRNTLAYAGPCAVRDAAFGGLPVVGAMTMDLADVTLLTGSTGALAMDVLTHELGHVLGIGTLWDGGLPVGDLTQTIAGDVRFIGAGASAAAVRLGLSASVDEGALIEDEGGMGTAGGHWRERVFLGELMTGWINAAPNPLSILTVQALRDLGYAVTETGADLVSPATIVGGTAFTASRSGTGGAALSRAGASSAPLALGERLIRPKVVVRNGRVVKRM